MVFECIAKAIGCEIGKRYNGKIRNKFSIDIKDETGKIVTHYIKKFRIIDDESVEQEKRAENILSKNIDKC